MMKVISLRDLALPINERRLAAWMFTSDPGFNRLRTAARVILAVATAALVSYLIIGQKAQVAPLFGGIVGLLGSLVINDPDPKQQRITTLLLIVPASLSEALGALLASFTWLSDIALVALIFLAFYLRRFGPRFMALGMLALMPFFISSIVHFEFEQFPWVVAASTIGVACVYLFRFVLLRDNPQRILRWSMAAFHTQFALTLESMIEALEGESPVEKAQKKLRRDTERLYKCATTAESQLSTPEFEESEEDLNRLRFYFFDSEMSAHVLSEVAYRLATSEDKIPSAVCDALLYMLRELRKPLSRGDSPTDHEAALEALENLERRRKQTSKERPGSWSFQVLRAEAAARQLLESDEADREQPPTSEELPEDLEDEEQNTGSGSGSLKDRLQTTTLQGIQAALAGGLAVVAGNLLSPNRSYWVVITAFIVFMRARSIGETLARGFERTIGTLLGVIAGFALASVISGDLYLEIVLILICAFIAFYLFFVSYALMVFWITIVLAIGYSLIGWLSGDLLALRFIDTLVGAAIGVTVSALVFPAKTIDKVKESTADFLKAFEDYVCSRLNLLAGATQTMHSLEEVRDLGSKLREVTQAADIIKKEAAVFGRSREDLDHLTTALVALDYHARHLARPLQREKLLDGDSKQSDLLEEIGERIAENVEALCETIAKGKKQRIRDIGDLLERVESRVESGEPSSNTKRGEDMLDVLHSLRRINRTLMEIAKEFEAEDEQSRRKAGGLGS